MTELKLIRLSVQIRTWFPDPWYPCLGPNADLPKSGTMDSYFDNNNDDDDMYVRCLVESNGMLIYHKGQFTRPP